MKPKWQKLPSLAQEIFTLLFQFFGAVFASKGYPFKNILASLLTFLISPISCDYGILRECMSDLRARLAPGNQ